MQPEYGVLAEIEPIIEKNLERHLALAQEWMPHDYVPWSRGRDFDDEPWEPGQSPLTDIARTAFEVNLLTEDNLPSYHREIGSIAGPDGAWGTWLGRWTAEEGRHSIVMRDYLLVARGIDPVALERGRMHQVQQGFRKPDVGPLGGLAYVAFQELATRVSHRNTGRFAGDPVADRLLARVAADENLHMIFYRDAISAALEVDPSRMVRAIVDEVVTFQMPGTGIIDFVAKAMRIAMAGIYDMRIHHDEVVMPLLRHWRIFERDDLDGSAAKARDELAVFLEGLRRLARRYEQRRAELATARAR